MRSSQVVTGLWAGRLKGGGIKHRPLLSIPGEARSGRTVAEGIRGEWATC